MYDLIKNKKQCAQQRLNREYALCGVLMLGVLFYMLVA